MSKAPPEPADFDKSLEQVEGIIRRIESGEIGLEASIAEYEKGVGLLRACRERLQLAEQRVKDLTAQLQADVGSGGADSAKARGPSGRSSGSAGSSGRE